MKKLVINMNYECGKTMKQLRQIEGISPEDVLKQIGISKSYLSELENGKKNIDIKLIQKFMLIFGESMTVSDFFILHEHLKDIKPFGIVKYILHEKKCKY
jgi:transcriptional regulator with XRE-family HTH domain